MALFKTCGGNGGAEGVGEDGQNGGKGANGRDTTRCREAEDGNEGASGGDGGLGTDGADGGDAGNVIINVHEMDLDCLSAISWDLSGGRGGTSGAHGAASKGGRGGYGSTSWSEPDKHDRRAHYRSSGNSGGYGQSGSRPTALLNNGRDGRPGQTMIRVSRANEEVWIYSDVYRLKVISFDISDENDDGIFEPGEEVTVRNIVVDNYGAVPSPGSGAIQAAVPDDTPGLHPTQTLKLPTIPPGTHLRVDGEIRATIHGDPSSGLGQWIHEKAISVKLQASVVRLGRTLRDFHTAAQAAHNIKIRYPLEVDPPLSLETVQREIRSRSHG